MVITGSFIFLQFLVLGDNSTTEVEDINPPMSKYEKAKKHFILSNC